jgi:hypothetical protein
MINNFHQTYWTPPNSIDPWSPEGVGTRLRYIFTSENKKPYISLHLKPENKTPFKCKVIIKKSEINNEELVEKINSIMYKKDQLRVARNWIEYEKIPHFEGEKLSNYESIDLKKKNTLKSIKSDSFKIKQLYFDSQKIANKQWDGSPFTHQISNLEKNLRKFSKNEKNLTDQEYKEILKIVDTLEETKNITLLQEIAIDLISLTLDRKSTTALTIYINKLIKEWLDCLQKTIQSKLSILKEGENFIIPCGYHLKSNSGRYVSHGILLEIRKKNTMYQIKVYDTGGFLCCQQGIKGKVHPLTYTNISIEALEALFHGKFFDIICSKIHASDGLEIYDQMDETLCIQYQAKKLYSQGKPYTEQKTGNCSYKCLKVWVHEELYPINHVYKKFQAYKLEREIQKVEPIQRKMSLWGLKSFCGLRRTATEESIDKFLADGRDKLQKKYREMANTTDPGISSPEENIEFYVRNGDLEQIKAAIKLAPTQLKTILKIVAKEGFPNVLKFLFEEDISLEDRKFAFKIAAEHGQRFILKLLYSKELFDLEDILEGLKKASSCLCPTTWMYLFHILMGFQKIEKEIGDIMKELANYERGDRMNTYLIKTQTLSPENIREIYRAAAVNGRIDILELLESKLTPQDRQEAYQLAARNGQEEVVSFFLSKLCKNLI